MSKGEEKIAFLLSQTQFVFKREQTFEGLKDRDFLRFDFAIYDREKNYQLVALIECDGIQHFKEVKHWGGRKGFLKRQEHDRKKNAFALARKILLIRIPYWDLETLTAQQIFNKREYRVSTIYHNDHLIPPK